MRIVPGGRLSRPLAAAFLLSAAHGAAPLDLGNPSAEEVQWRVREAGPRLWHTDRLVSDEVADAILALTGIREEPWEWTKSVHTIPIIHHQAHPAIMEVRRRIADVQGLPLEHFEPAFLLEYMPGMDCKYGQSMPHYDWNCPTGRGDDESETGCPDMRISTNILYLNTLPSPLGETVLPKAGLSFPVTKGAFVGWHNGDHLTRRKDPMAQHLGRCIPATEANATRKYALVNWIRASPIDFDTFSGDVCEEDPDSCLAGESLRFALFGEEDEETRLRRQEAASARQQEAEDGDGEDRDGGEDEDADGSEYYYDDGADREL